MSIGLIVERRGEAVEKITVEEWAEFVSIQSGIRLRTEPYLAVNPLTEQKIVLPCGEADAEILSNGEWVPFLRFRRGRLVAEYQDEFDHPSNEIRIAIVYVAATLGAVIGTDLDDELVDW